MANLNQAVASFCTSRLFTMEPALRQMEGRSLPIHMCLQFWFGIGAFGQMAAVFNAAARHRGEPKIS